MTDSPAIKLGDLFDAHDSYVPDNRVDVHLTWHRALGH
jgi:hypothetical protein